MKLSLIMNVCDACEDKLDESLGRIRDSYLKNDEYELIVIDDGSTKNYSEIIKKYDPVYVKTPHRGNLSAILYGIMIAKGEYIAFLNPMVQPSFNYYKGMLEGATDVCADVVVGEVAYNENGAKFKNKLDPITNNEIAVEGEHALRFFARDLIESESVSSLYNKIFKKETLLLAKKELEKTDAVACKSFDMYGEMLLCFFAVKNAKKMINTNTGYAFFDILSENSNGNSEEKETSFNIMVSVLPQNDYLKEMTKNIEACRMAYIKNNIGLFKKAYLGDNFLEIDREISKFYKSDVAVNLVYDKKDAYVSRIVDMLVAKEGKQISGTASRLIVIPKRKISLIQKIKSKF